MTVPSADLTTAHLDASTDDPAQARVELKAAVDKINAIINDLGAGNTVWTNANDGAGSGLDSDLLDGQSSAYYRDAGNINAGTLALGRGGTGSTTASGARTNLGLGALATLGSISASELQSDSVSASAIQANAVGASEIATGAVGADEIAASAVAQGELKTTTQTGSVTVGSYAGVLFTGGEYCFMPDSAPVSGVSTADRHITSVQFDDGPGTSSMLALSIGYNGSNHNFTVRYVQASPPYEIGGVDFPLFCFLQLDANGEVIQSSFAEDPPWAYNGPTNTRPNVYEKLSDGTVKKYRRGLANDPDELAYIKTNPKKYLEMRQRREHRNIEVTPSFKNADIDIIPHPFINADGGSVVLVAPDDHMMQDLKTLHSDGGNLPGIFKDHIKIDNSAIALSGLPGAVKLCKATWR